MKNQLKDVFYWDQPFLVGRIFSCSIEEKRSLVCLVNRLLEQAPNQVASHAVVLRLVDTRGKERVTSLRTSAWEATNQVATVKDLGCSETPNFLFIPRNRLYLPLSP